MSPTGSRLTKEVNDTLHTGSNERAIRYLDTASAYDQWSKIYDTDGNFLQALDSVEMQELLPQAMSLVSPATTNNEVDDSSGIRVIDLGCGTGRNTIHLLDNPQIGAINAIDLSPNMLELARNRMIAKLSQLDRANKPSLNFEVRDMIKAPTPDANSPLADLIISTLVVEHVPLPTFFAYAAQMLRPGGILLMTNMHSEMGNISQAGFVDPKTGDKIRPTSYAHTVEDVLLEAEKCGLEIVGDEEREGIKEVKMTKELTSQLGVRSEKWVGIDVWFGGIWRKKERETNSIASIPRTAEQEPKTFHNGNCPECKGRPNLWITPEELGRLYSDVDKLW